MKTLYIDCGMGAAGDMLAAALLELLPDKESFLREMNHLGIPGVTVAAEKSVKCGISGTHFRVRVHGEEEGEHLGEYADRQHHGHGHEHTHHEHEQHRHEPEHGRCHEHEHFQHKPEHGHQHHEHGYHGHEHEHTHHHHGPHHEHHHHGMEDIEHLIGSLPLPAEVKSDALAVYQLIAEAESHVHGVPVHQIHFHEVGNMDAVADIIAVCLLMRRLNPDRVIASPVHVGSGSVRCAHGILPVPAPATAHILREAPVYGGAIRGELCTPTGAALLKYFAAEFGDMPVMSVQSVGYGMGKKDFERANCVRVMLGETADKTDFVVELMCNVDDMTGEAMGFAIELFMENGALDAFTVPVGMKKSRPGTLICVLCRETDKEKFVRLMFKHTTTLGIREKLCRRYTLERTVETVETPHGAVRKKLSAGYGVQRSKYEYEDLARIAKEQNLSIAEILNT